MLKYQLPICIVMFDYSPLMILQDLLVESCSSSWLSTQICLLMISILPFTYYQHG